MNIFPYNLTPEHPPQLGLIALQSDETIERDFHQMLPPGIELMVTRVPSGEDVTAETLQKMEASLTGAAALFPRAANMSAVAYGCTSGTAQIGQARVAEMVNAGVATPAVTEPVSALIAACARLGITRLALLSPYLKDVSDRLCAVLLDAGIETVAFGSFNEASEAKVVRIDAASILAAGEHVARMADCQALFLSCTNLRTLDVIEALETKINLPVLSSNQVLAWHLFGLVGHRNGASAPGQLWHANRR